MDFEKGYFEKHYGDNSSTKNPVRKLNFILNEIKKHKREGKLLDIGFGYGAFLLYAKKDFQVYGVDYSSYTVAKMQQQIKTVKQGSAENIPFGDNFFDVVTLLDVLEHVPDPSKRVYKLMDTCACKKP